MFSPRSRSFSYALLGLVFVLGAALIPGCDYTQGSGTVIVQFQHSSGGAELLKDELIYTTPPPASYEYSVDLFEYLITDVTFWKKDGTFVRMAAPHYGNAFDGAPHQARFNVPVDSYVAISFQWGVAEEENKSNTLTEDFDGMLWPPPMGGGYHCMRFEGDYTLDAPGDKSFALHMGRTAPVADPMGRVTNSSVHITLDDSDFILGQGNTWTATIDVDVDNFMNDPLYDFQAPSGLPDGILAGPVMPSHVGQALLRDNTGDVFSLVSLQRN